MRQSPSALPWLLAATIALSVGCKDKENTFSSVPESYAQKTIEPKAGEELNYEPVPVGSPLRETVRLRFAIYFLPTSKRDPQGVLRRLIKSRYTFLSLSEDEDSGVVPFAVVHSPNISEFYPPDVAALEYIGRGLNSKDIAAVQTTQEALLVDISLLQKDGATQHREVMKLMAELATKTGGILWDESTRELYSQDAWVARYADWDLDSQEIWSLFTIHSYRDGELFRLLTLGLEKFGLPEIAVRDVSSGDAVGMSSLINLVVQTLRSGATVDEHGVLSVDTLSVPGSWKILDGGLGTANVTLAIGTRLEGDADNQLWEIVFPDGPDSEAQIRQQALLQQLFGATDELVQGKHDDELELASSRGLAKLATLKTEFQRDWPVGDTLLVKGPFETDEGGNEWMWIEVVSWKGNVLKGILQNKPFLVRELKAGARVESKFELLFDYRRHHADGTISGNETGAILSQQQQK
jgi:uncharacterized protein YegJ (DUF2314 family)